jgi:hypothetical protein
LNDWPLRTVLFWVSDQCDTQNRTVTQNCMHSTNCITSHRSTALGNGEVEISRGIGIPTRITGWQMDTKALSCLFVSIMLDQSSLYWNALSHHHYMVLVAVMVPFG